MGALHRGHLSLVSRARAECDKVVVSVFVNPLQFNDPRDYRRYPRNFEADAAMLADSGCDMAFTGTLAGFFPGSRGDVRRIPWREPSRAARGLEGQYRPGHFRGVATIVARLFELTRPSKAYFGAKDFQQTLVVSDLARELGFPEIVVCDTDREPSGLARSSRNALLSAAEKKEARAIYAALLASRRAWRQGEREPAALSARMLRVLERSDLAVEYAQVRDPERWSAQAPRRKLQRAVALIAARSGAVRLIDNLRLDGAGGKPKDARDPFA